MGRRKNNNSSSATQSFNNSHQQHRGFEDADEDLTTESSNLQDSVVMSDKAVEDDSMSVPDDVSFMDADDGKTSADYYFDSYSHFGIVLLIELNKSV